MEKEVLASYIDHAVLDPQFTVEKLRELIMIGVNTNCKTVCVNPDSIQLAKECIGSSDTKLCVVCDFPFGSSHTKSKLAQCQAIIDEGDIFEIDMVANYGRIISGNLDYVSQEIKQMSDLCHASNVGLKVIVETDALTLEQVDDALECCVKGEADFIKTSTGYFKKPDLVGAEPSLIKHMIEKAAGRIKVKGSGCVRSKERLETLIELGVDRAGVGCGSTMKILGD